MLELHGLQLSGTTLLWKEASFQHGQPPTIVTGSEVGPTPIWSEPTCPGHVDGDVWKRKALSLLI